MGRKNVVIPKDQGAGLSNEQRIGVLLQHTCDNESVFYALCRMRPNLAAIEDNESRRRYARNHGVECPAFDATFRQRLMEQIRKVKCRYLDEVREDEILKPSKSDDGSAVRVADIDIVDIPRFSLGIPALDQILGKDDKTGMYGMPKGACLIFGAEKGTGKTRLSVEVAANVGSPYRHVDANGNNGVLYIQNEEKISIFRTRAAKSWTDEHNIWVSSSDNLLQHQSLIDKHKPKLVIIDSMQDTIQSRYIGGLMNMLTTYKAIAEDTGISFWLISHLTVKGTIKGGSYPGHKVDIELIAKRNKEDKALFDVSCPTKNRYGATDIVATFRHTEAGVRFVGMTEI